MELSPGKGSLVGAEFTLLQPATAQHYYPCANQALVSAASAGPLTAGQALVSSTAGSLTEDANTQGN